MLRADGDMQAQAAADLQQPAGGQRGLEAEPTTGTSAQQQDASESRPPLPLPYLLDGDGRKQPLPGAKSIFVRGGCCLCAQSLMTHNLYQAAKNLRAAQSFARVAAVVQAHIIDTAQKHHAHGHSGRSLWQGAWCSQRPCNQPSFRLPVRVHLPDPDTLCVLPQVALLRPLACPASATSRMGSSWQQCPGRSCWLTYRCATPTGLWYSH